MSTEEKKEHVNATGETAQGSDKTSQIALGADRSDHQAANSTSKNKTFRIIFFLGLEGSGHHFIKHLLENNKPKRRKWRKSPCRRFANGPW